MNGSGQRGIPSTQGIRDVATKRVVDALVERVRGASTQAAAATSRVVRQVSTAALRLVSLGGGEPVGASLAGGVLTLRTLKAGTNITITIVDGALVIAASGGTTYTATLPVAVTGTVVSLNVPGLDAETFAAESHVFLVHNGSVYKKTSLGDMAGVSSSGVDAWKIPVATATGVQWKTITEILVNAVTTTKDPTAGDDFLAKDSAGALFWADSGECAS